jgi:hypothetical protein
MSNPILRNLNISTPVIPQSTIDSIVEQNRRKNEAINSTNFLAEFQRASLASEFARQILSDINDFDSQLDANNEVGVKLVSFGQTITFHVSDIGYYNPGLILFRGVTENGDSIRLLQHVSQISFVLIKLPKLNPEQPKTKIGFIQEES